MRLWPRLPRLFTLVALGMGGLVGALASRAHARLSDLRVSTTTEVIGGAGYDDNQRLFVSPDDTSGRLHGVFARVAPSLVLGLPVGPVRLVLSYAGDARAAEQLGIFYAQELALWLAASDLGRLAVELGPQAGRFDATDFVEDRFVSVGGSAAARLRLWPSLRFLADYRFDLRQATTGVDAPRAHLHVLGARLSWRPTSRLEISPFFELLRLGAVGATAAPFQRIRSGISGLVAYRSVTLNTSGWAGPLTTAAGTGDTVSTKYVGASVGIRVRVFDWLDALGTFDATLAIDRAMAPDLGRNQVFFGVAVHFGSQPHTARPVGEESPLVQIEGQTVRLRLQSSGAQKVEVLGSWNMWQAPGRSMHRASSVGAPWETTFVLEPGIYRYHFLVDGKAVSPPAAPRYAPDGFGGQDGVLDVTAPGAIPIP